MKKFFEEAVIGLGWLYGKVYRFIYDWHVQPDIRHARAAILLLMLVIFLFLTSIL